MSLENCRVVLVRPEVAGNIGSTARVMRNFGLKQLILVAPVADPAERQARQYSAQGERILQQAQIVPDLKTALADCVVVAGTSARLGGLFRRQSLGSPEEIVTHLLDAANQPVALVFGPEPTGLPNTEIAMCHYLIHIPTDADYPALNLAQAVTICLYELRRKWLARKPAPERDSIAAFADQQRMFEQLQTALEEIHFLYGEKAESLMHGLRHLIGRAEPTAMEVKLLMGLARQIRWSADKNKNV